MTSAAGFTRVLVIFAIQLAQSPIVTLALSAQSPDCINHQALEIDLKRK